MVNTNMKMMQHSSFQEMGVLVNREDRGGECKGYWGLSLEFNNFLQVCFRLGRIGVSPVFYHVSFKKLKGYNFADDSTFQVTSLPKVNSGNTKTRRDVIDVILKSLLLPWNRFHTWFWCFYCWLWASKYQLNSLKNIGFVEMSQYLLYHHQYTSTLYWLAEGICLTFYVILLTSSFFNGFFYQKYSRIKVTSETEWWCHVADGFHLER